MGIARTLHGIDQPQSPSNQRGHVHTGLRIRHARMASYNAGYLGRLLQLGSSSGMLFAARACTVFVNRRGPSDLRSSLPLLRSVRVSVLVPPCTDVWSAT
jgi:hypothetical protein